ncbi:MAG: prepilin-type N-terminal cleavage/methylation domain-containing protein [Phycisphaerales bacterium]|nr:MAG: prepilin-type N-terminal cleavage/methylation domain-containing protein [Phycisphaerales bacterium]
MPRWSRKHDNGRPRPTRRGRPAAHSGFTLVELAFVAAIIAIVGAIAVPRFTDAHLRASLAGAADRISADIDRARRHAVASESYAAVGFNPADNRYAVAWDGGASSYAVELGESPLRVGLKAFRGGDREDMMIFGPTGLSAFSSGLVISNRGAAILILVDRAGNTTREVGGDAEELVKKLELLFTAPPEDDEDDEESGGSSGGLLSETIKTVSGLL